MDDQQTPTNPNDSSAASFIRHKLDDLYQAEPNAKAEETEIAAVGVVSQHQQFMADLMASGKTYAEIQIAWHGYYQSQPDHEKHAIWREFYENQARSSHYNPHRPASSDTTPQTDNNTGHTDNIGSINPSTRTEQTIAPNYRRPRKYGKSPAGNFLQAGQAVVKSQTVAEIKARIARKVTAGGKLKIKHHFKSLFFGLGLGGAFLLLILFIMFNQLVVGPFITPSRAASATPLITDPTGTDVGQQARVIIPKISVDAPIITDAANNEEKTIQAALENGVVLYPFTGLPGENSNPVIFGHSSNNLFNKGAYKFVFVSLNKLEINDTFMVNYSGKQYTYKVFDKKIVKPSDVNVLIEHPRDAMLTLITCDPPGTNTNRLIVQGEQINPDPNANTTATQPRQINTTKLPGSPESFIKRVWNTIF